MISKHISYKEATYSRTATRLGIENKPDEDQLKRQTKLPDMRELLSLTTQLQGIDKRVPIRNSLMSQAINNNRASQPVTT